LLHDEDEDEGRMNEPRMHQIYSAEPDNHFGNNINAEVSKIKWNTKTTIKETKGFQFYLKTEKTGFAS